MPSVQQVPVTVLNAANAPLAGRVVTLVSSNPAVATVPPSVVSDATGVATYPVTAVGLGACDITETSEGKSATTHVTVGSSDTVASVDVSPNGVTIDVGGTVDLTATPRNSSGAPLSDPVTWASSNAAVATVDSNGLVTGVGAGTCNITATDGAVVGTAAITVQVATLTRQLWWAADTLALTDGQAVSPWADQVGGVTASQSSSAAKPAYDSNAIGGHPGVVFDVGDQLRFTMPAGDSAQITRFCVATPGLLSAPTGDMVLWSTPMADLRVRANGAIRFTVRKTGGLIVEWDSAVGVVALAAGHLFKVVYDASNLANNPSVRLDGADVAVSLSGGAQSGTRVADVGTGFLGTDSGLSREVLGPESEFVFIASTADSSSEETRLLTKFGIGA